MRVLIADGGTGGHIFPALAVADEIKRRFPEGEILFTGTRVGLESDLVPRHGYELQLIHVGGLIGKSAWIQARTLMQLPFAYMESRSIIKQFQPEVVIGFGAYASGPVLVAAHHRKIPILLVEPNAIPGFTNRMVLKYARFVAVPYEDTDGVFSGKAIVTGNPVRKLRKVELPKPKFTVGVFGGSQGARAINQTVVQALSKLGEMKEQLHMIHQTGKNDFESVQRKYQELAPEFEVTAFVHDVEQFYGRCDLLICRAGAITLAEITALGKPSILVPLPTAAHNHQEKNARRLEEAGASKMILQKDFTAESLVSEIRALIDSPEKLRNMANASSKLGKPGATSSIVDLVESITRPATHQTEVKTG